MFLKAGEPVFAPRAYGLATPVPFAARPGKIAPPRGLAEQLLLAVAGAALYPPCVRTYSEPRRRAVAQCDFCGRHFVPLTGPSFLGLDYALAETPMTQQTRFRRVCSRMPP